MRYSRCLLFPVLIFLSPACTPDRYSAAGNSTICTALSDLATYDGDAHLCHARRRDQGCPRVEWHDPCAVIHAWLLESYFCLAKGTPYNVDVQWYQLELIGCRVQLLLPWRFFRLWALVDGMDPPENMVRCMANNYSPLGFWRSWHRSYNLWIVRYLYIPLGGTHRLAATSILIFTFVALWHDLSPRLLAWGWLAAIFILPEVMARRVLPPSMVRGQPFQFLTARDLSMNPFLLGSLFYVCSLVKDGGIVTRARPAASLTSC